MATALLKIVADNKDLVENVMEAFEKGAEVLASITGDLFPIFSIAAPVVKLALDNVESKEAEFMKDQFQRIRERLEVISEEVRDINDEVKKSMVDTAYFSVEENITNQFRKYMDILNAPPKFREVKKTRFMTHFEKTGSDENLHTLYSAVTGDNFSGESVLEITLNYEKKSRQSTEDFCIRLYELFFIGLIALMGHTALKGGEDEEELLQGWAEKMKVVRSKMNLVIEDCINSFPSQAEEDIRCLVRDHRDKNNKQLADMIIKNLEKKYDWVYWSVRIFYSPTGCFTSKKDFQCATGKSRFQVPAPDDNLNVEVSYSASPEPVDKAQIQQLIQSQKKPTVPGIAELLFEKNLACVVHTVKRFNDKEQKMAHSKSFKEEFYFFEDNKNFYVLVHSA